MSDLFGISDQVVEMVERVQTPQWVWQQRCNHCWCLDVTPTAQRPKPHVRCCKCYDVMVKA